MSRGDFQAGAQAARRALGGMMAGKANYLVRAKNGAVFVTSTLAEAKKVEASGAAPAKRRRNPASSNTITLRGVIVARKKSKLTPHAAAIRHSDYSSKEPATLEPFVRVNRYGSVFVSRPLDASEYFDLSSDERAAVAGLFNRKLPPRRNPSAAEHLKLGFESLSAAEKALKSYAAAGLNDHARQKIALHAMRSADLAYREFTHAGGSRAGYAAQIDAAHDALEEAQALLSHHLKHNPAKRRRNPSAAEHKKRGAEHLQNSMDFLLDFVPKLRRLQEQAGPKSGLYKPELRRAYSSALEAAALANQDLADAGMGYTGDRSLAISALEDARDGLIANPKRRRNPYVAGEHVDPSKLKHNPKRRRK